MGEDDIVELLRKSGQVVPSSQAQRPSSDTQPILRGSGSGEINAPLPLPQRPPPQHLQSLFVQEDKEIIYSSWLHHPLRQDYLFSELDAPPPLPLPQPSAPYGQIIAARRAENLMNFLRLRGNILSGSRVEAGPSIPVGSNSTTSATESNLTPATKSRATVIGGVSRTFAVPSRGRKEKTVCEIAGTSSSGVEIEPVQIQSVTDIAEDRKRKEREETIAEIQGTEEACGSTFRMRSRAAEMHNLSEKKRREKINEKMKTLQELIPRCNKTNKASTLDDVIEYVKWLQMQIQMMSMGHGMMPPMMYAGNMQQFMPHMAMGMMGMNRPPPFIPFPSTPFPRAAHMAGVPPSYPAPRSFQHTQASDSSRVHLPSPQHTPMSNQPLFSTYMNPYSQLVGLHQMQRPAPPLQSQTTSQLSVGQASSSKEAEDNQPTV